jgi:hypothetical protein
MPYYHATLEATMPSIRRHGLGGIDPGPRSEPCARGVYLAAHPSLAVQMAVMHALNTASAGARTPREALAAVRVVVVDDTRLDARRLRPDPQVTHWAGAWVYAGVIDVTGLPVLTVEEALSGGEHLEAERCGWRTHGPADV